MGGIMPEEPASPYETHLEILFPHLQVIDVAEIAEGVKHPWWNGTLCQVNESVVRLGVVEGQYHWHKHEQLDEFFYVVSGRLLIDMEDRMIDLRPQQCFVIPKGVRHRPRAPERTVILMVEGADIIPTGD